MDQIINPETGEVEVENEVIPRKVRRPRKPKTTNVIPNVGYGYVVKNVPDYSRIDGEFVKKLRRKLNLSEKNFADMLGVLPETVINWESNVKKPSTVTQRLLFLLNRYPEMSTELFVLEKNWTSATDNVETTVEANPIDTDETDPEPELEIVKNE